MGAEIPFRKNGNTNQLLRGVAPRARKGADRALYSAIEGVYVTTWESDKNVDSEKFRRFFCTTPAQANVEDNFIGKSIAYFRPNLPEGEG